MDKTSGRDANQLLGILVRTEGKKEQAVQLVSRQLPWLVQKAGVSGTNTADLVGSFDSLVGGEFLASMEHAGVYDSLSKRSRRAALQTPLFTPSTPVVGSSTAEGVHIPVSLFAFDSSGLTPTKAVAMAVASNEALRTNEGIDWLETELREAVTLATDKKLIAILKAAATSPATATADPVDDIKTLLDAVSKTGFGQLFFLVSPATANTLATWRDAAGGNLLFPDCGPEGGLLAGVTVLVSAAVADTEMLLVDARGLVTGDQSLTLNISTSAMIEIDSVPAGESLTPTGATGAVISLFQADCTGVIANRTFASKVLRASAVQLLSTINW